jgi:hypothetical protein
LLGGVGRGRGEVGDLLHVAAVEHRREARPGGRVVRGLCAATRKPRLVRAATNGELSSPNCSASESARGMRPRADHDVRHRARHLRARGTGRDDVIPQPMTGTAATTAKAQAKTPRLRATVRRLRPSASSPRRRRWNCTTRSQTRQRRAPPAEPTPRSGRGPPRQRRWRPGRHPASPARGAAAAPAPRDADEQRAPQGGDGVRRRAERDENVGGNEGSSRPPRERHGRSLRPADLAQTRLAAE